MNDEKTVLLTPEELKQIKKGSQEEAEVNTEDSDDQEKKDSE